MSSNLIRSTNFIVVLDVVEVIKKLRIAKTHIETYMDSPPIDEKLAMEKDPSLKNILKYARYYNKSITELLMSDIYKYSDANKFFGDRGLSLSIFNSIIANKAAYVNCAIPAWYLGMGGKTYVPDENFHRDFLKVNLDGVQFRHLPKNETGYIQFPKPFISDEGVKISGGYYFCGDYQGTYNKEWFEGAENTPNAKKFKKSIILSWEGDEPEGTLDSLSQKSQNFIHITVPEDESLEIQTEMVNLDNVNYSSSNGREITVIADAYKEVPRLFFKYMVYIKSGNPDIRKHRNKFTFGE